MQETMTLEPCTLDGRDFVLEPLTPAHEAEMQAMLDCDHDHWKILYSNGAGEGFATYWQGLTATPGRIAFAARDKASGRLAGTSGYIHIDPHHRSLEVGGTWYHPDFRGTRLNPEAKYLLLGHAFGAGALRAWFQVDARNARSQAAMRKLGATEEGIARRHMVTWTGHKRDSVIFSILDDEWPAVQARLEARLR